ncbi:hypothetical protein AAVH_12901 [Aphelenchoides avenae]|nr:hypothetical protein AAVH_12901 [Aphelenchus avenae]
MASVDDVKRDLTHLKDEFDAYRLKGEGKLPALGLPSFNGRVDDKSFREFLQQFYAVGNLYGWDNKRCCQVIRMCLNGEAAAVYETLPEDTKKDWTLLTDTLAERLFAGSDPVQTQDLLARRCQRKGESVADFALAVRTLVQRAYPKGEEVDGAKPHTYSYQERMAVRHFIRGLRPALKEVIVRQETPKTLTEAISRASKEEQLQRTLREDLVKTDLETVNSIQLDEMRDEVKDLRKQMSEMKVSGDATSQIAFVQAPQPARNNQPGRFRNGEDRRRQWNRRQDFNRRQNNCNANVLFHASKDYKTRTGEAAAAMPRGRNAACGSTIET